MTNSMKLLDKSTGQTETLLETTVSSFNVTQTATNSKGIDCTQWFTEENFNKNFTFID